ncbi:hypothetical protein ACIRP7_11900 [Streptomyces sp. NPDC102270]|uniref:hypothetical protein n=1 Tax=Streptomyces sp. NPDC102270 TaxID=3366150 RepID=UPI003810A372
MQAATGKDMVEECGGGRAGCRDIADQLGLRQCAAVGQAMAPAFDEFLAGAGVAPP